MTAGIITGPLLLLLCGPQTSYTAQLDDSGFRALADCSTVVTGKNHKQDRPQTIKMVTESSLTPPTTDGACWYLLSVEPCSGTGGLALSGTP